MSVEVRIPTPLRKFTGGSDKVSVDGATVGQALDSLAEAHPEIKSRIFDDEGQVRRFVNIFANDEDIRFQDKLETTLSDGDQIALVPAIAGG
jgi:sulfur-carrier protein